MLKLIACIEAVPETYHLVDRDHVPNAVEDLRAKG
jgi:hypothetical protein